MLDTTPPQPKTSTPSSKQGRSNSSISEDVSERTSSSISDEDSQKAITFKKVEKVKDVSNQRQSEELEGQKDSSVVSEVSEDIPSTYSSASATPDVSLRESPRFDPNNETRRASSDEQAVQGQSSEDKELSDASNVPEEVLSVANSISQDSVRSTSKVLDLHQKTEPTKPAEDGGMDTSGLGSPAHLPVHTMEDLSQRSEQSYSYSSSIRSMSSHRSRTHSEQSGASYSDELFESSVSIGFKNKENLSDTDDDISEQLSIASEPSVASGGKLAFDLTADKSLEDTTVDIPEVAPRGNYLREKCQQRT